MEKTKEQMIADLYALRGGLSVISGHTDEIRRQEGLIKVNKDGEAKIAVVESQNDQQLKLLHAERIKYDNLIVEQKKQEAKVCQEKRREILKNKEIIGNKGKLRKTTEWAKSANIAWGILAVIIIPMMVWSIIDFQSIENFFYEWLVHGGNSKSDFVDLLVGLSAYFLPLIFIILVGFAVGAELHIQFSEMKDRKWQLLSKNEKLEKEIQQEEQLLYAYQGKKSEITNKIRRVTEDNERENEHNKKARAVYEEKNKACGKQIQAITEQSKLVKAALNETYDSWLSESDWINVDLLIYYLETSRADDLKEALQLVDKQRQTETITKAIATAARAIQDTVHTATMRLAGAMEASFSLLSDKLSAINAKMGSFNALVEQNNELQEKYAQNVSAMSSQLAKVQGEQLAIQKELLNAEKLNGALLEKANRSSEELLNDLRYGQRYWVK